MSPNFHQFSPSLWVKQNDPFATNTGIVLSAGQVCLIDPGISPSDCTEIQEFVASQDAEVKAVVLTHAHWDHILGTHYFPGVQVVAHHNYQYVIQNHSMHLAQQVSAWWLSVFDRPNQAWTPPTPSIYFTHKLDVHIGALSICLLHAPGHTNDHIVLYIPQHRTLWAGDMVSDRELPLVEDIDAYKHTLAILKAMQVMIMIPGHGTPAASIADIQTRFIQDDAYVSALRTCVQKALVQGIDINQTVKACSDISFNQPDTYPNAHRWNIESAYRGICDTPGGVVGWDNEWSTLALF